MINNKSNNSSFLNSLYDKIEKQTVKRLTKKKAKKEYKKQNRSFWTETLDWINAIVFAVFVVLLINQFLFQFFVIPSPSMLETLQIKDRVSVSKITYGIELWPEGPKIFDKRVPLRDEIITFYNPQYQKRSAFFNIISKILYMGTFSLVNIDRNEDGSIRESLLVKRTAGVAGDTITFRNGQAFIRPSALFEYQNEADFRQENSYVLAPHTTIKPDTYKAYRSMGFLEGLHSKGFDRLSFPKRYESDYKSLNQSDFFTDYYEYSKNYYLGQHIADPSDFEVRSHLRQMQIGIYVPEDHVLPLGDNRDNSSDGRYFGPVPVNRINGYVATIIWPLNRIGNPDK